MRSCACTLARLPSLFSLARLPLPWSSLAHASGLSPSAPPLRACLMPDSSVIDVDIGCGLTLLDLRLFITHSVKCRALYILLRDFGSRCNLPTLTHSCQASPTISNASSLPPIAPPMSTVFSPGGLDQSVGSAKLEAWAGSGVLVAASAGASSPVLRMTFIVGADSTRVTCESAALSGGLDCCRNVRLEPARALCCYDCRL